MSSLATYNKITAVFLCLLACGSGMATYAVQADSIDNISLAGQVVSGGMLTTAAILAWHGANPTTIAIIASMVFCGAVALTVRQKSMNTIPE